MALISCPECKRQISDHAFSCPHCGYPLQEAKEDIFCPYCGAPNLPSADYCEQCGVRLTPYAQSSAPIVPKYQPIISNSYGILGRTVYCPRCGSEDLSHHYETIGYRTRGHEETRKKSIITRTGNKAGRAGMILLTGGLWALTPKKSKYRTTQTSTTQAKRVRVLDCNDCGYSWQQ